MIIGIDASRANRENKTGTEWYCWHLIEEFKKITPGNERVFLYSNEKLKGDLGISPDNFQEIILKWPPKYLWTQIRLWWELLLRPPDVLFVPAHTIPFLPIWKKVKVAVTVHDVGFKRFPELYKPIQVWYHDLTMRKIKHRADLIITDSEFSRQEIMDLYGIETARIKVVYLGYDADNFFPATVIARESHQRRDDRGNPVAETRDLHALSPVPLSGRGSARDDNIGRNDVLQKYNITKPYLLYIGRIEKKKNIGNLAKSFSLLKERFPELKLVLAGNAGNEFEAVKKIIADNRLQQEIILPGYIAAGDLRAVIGSAEIFLFPTLYEGFGLPILEAMACGTPVITSALNPHREVGGEAAVYIDPQKPEELAGAIAKILADLHFRKELVDKGLQRVKNFSWKKTAQDVLDELLSLNQ